LRIASSPGVFIYEFSSFTYHLTAFTLDFLYQLNHPSIFLPTLVSIMYICLFFSHGVYISTRIVEFLGSIEQNISISVPSFTIDGVSIGNRVRNGLISLCVFEVVCQQHYRALSVLRLIFIYSSGVSHRQISWVSTIILIVTRSRSLRW
jgi:hypothetical protein